MNSTTYISVFLGLLVIYVLREKRKAKLLPPGPSMLSILVKMDLMSTELWIRVRQWGQKYGQGLDNY